MSAHPLAASVPAPASGNRTFAFTAALVDELVACGVRHVCVSPGSRSAPLAAAAVRASRRRPPRLRVWTHVDERAGGFFALGVAKTLRAPVAVVCTSGTAAANLLPAVVEAYYARVPLVILTADRPPELREWGAGQTIDQLRLFGTHVRWFAEAPTPDAAAVAPRSARALACRAVAEATGPPRGPVHLNLPFREPLHPAAVAGECLDDAAPRGDRPWLEVRRALPPPSPDDTAELAALVRRHERGLLVCGPDDAHPDLAWAAGALASAAGWPLLAECTSPVRAGARPEGTPLVRTAGWLLADADFAAGPAPEVVVQLGAAPTARPLRQWLDARPPGQWWLVDPEQRWADPGHRATRALRADAAAFCEAVTRLLGPPGMRRAAAAPRESAWLRRFATADRCAAEALSTAVRRERRLFEPRVVREVAHALPDGALLVASSSMPVRLLDAHWPADAREPRLLANRGANGIDGVVSTALGAAAAHAGPVVLLTGDLAFLHDLGGLVALARHDLRLAVVLLNDDGGGIFQRLPIAAWGDAVGFEECFRVRHGLDPGRAAALFGLRHRRVRDIASLRAALRGAFEGGGAAVVEVPLDPEASVAHEQSLARTVAAALAPLAAEEAP